MIVAYAALGALVGAVSGLVGIGGGILIVPALVFVFKMTQHQAQGTTLALLVPPIGLLAALEYYRQGYVDVRAALWICLGFALGSWFGAKFALGLSELALRRIFGFALVAIGAKFLLWR